MHLDLAEGHAANADSRVALWTSRTMSGLASLFLILDGVMKLIKPSFVVTATTGLGFPESTIVGIGVTLLICTLLYLWPRTAILGAILLTGYLGGAIASKVRVEAPAFDIAFALGMAALIWGGLWLRDPALRDLFPWRTKGGA